MISFWFLSIVILKIAEAGVIAPVQAGHEGATHVARVPLTQHSPRSTSVAICKLVSSADKNVSGDIVLRQTNANDPVEITGMVSGLTPGYHGFHVHQNPDLSDNCKAAGSHFNPENLTHGAPYDSVRHVGDLGNIPADNNGFSNFQFLDKKITLFGNPEREVLMKSIVIHEKEDDLGRGGTEESKKTGSAGSRVACCIIEPVDHYYTK